MVEPDVPGRQISVPAKSALRFGIAATRGWVRRSSVADLAPPTRKADGSARCYGGRCDGGVPKAMLSAAGRGGRFPCEPIQAPLKR
jgi:hypothetical protein